MSHIQCIIGLGNPGEKYATTRHNAGAWFVDCLADQKNISLKLDKKCRGYFGEFAFGQQKCFLFKPATYMNGSGLAVFSFLQFYKIPLESVLIAHDELDFEPGITRLKKEGGHGGHNGLRDIIQQFNSSSFYRLRIGIGHPGHRDDVSDYVLSTPSREDKTKIVASLEEAVMIVPELLSGHIQKAFHVLHSD